MADKKQFDDNAPPAGQTPSDLDPFAELTRIMGFDPRTPAETKAKPDASVADLAETLARADEAAAMQASQSAHADIARHIEAAHQPAEELADDFGIDLERELLGDMLADGEPTYAVEAAPLADAVATAPQPEITDAEFEAAFADDADALTQDVTEESREEELSADVDALNAAFAEIELETAAPAELEQAVAAELANVRVDADAASEMDDLNFDDLDLGDIEAAIGREMEQSLSATAAKKPAVVETAEEEDLTAALDNFFGDDFDDEPAEEVPAAFEAGKKGPEGLADVDMDFDAGLDWSELDARKQAASERTVAAAAPAVAQPTDEDDDLIAALEAATAEVKPGEYGVAPAASNEDPFSALAKMAERYQTQNPQDVWRQPVRASQPRAAAPEVETTEMFDQAFSMADDLELPEVAYEEPVKATNDLDLEFDRLLNEMSRGDVPPARPVAPMAAAPTQRYEPREPVAARPEPRQTDDYGFDSVFAQGEVEDHQAHDLGNFEFDEEEDEDQQPQAPYRAHDSRGGGRGMMIAMIVGGIAILGGVGALAMSWSGGSGGEPALVKADAGPVKVRPENPGGTSVPNQDSTVYDTVSRSGATEQPSQERLVSATEEPVEIPQPNDEEADEIAAMAKGEDRVEPGQADEVAAAEDPIAVAPRKVRTMVVKPDGSLVPAEEPTATAAPAQAEPTVEDIAAAPEGEPEQITTGATTPTPEPATEAVAAAAPAPGGWAVQIASQPSEDGANKSMKTMGQRYASAIGDRGMHIVKAEVAGKGTYWRVRVAAASRDDAVNVCSDLKSAGGSCFVTK
jgi:hypothetical protein